LTFDGPRVRATIEVFRRVARIDRQIKLCLWECSGSTNVNAKEAFAVDSVSDMELFGGYSQLWSRQAGTFLRHALFVILNQSSSVIYCCLPREQVEYLGDGLVTVDNSNSQQFEMPAFGVCQYSGRGHVGTCFWIATKLDSFRLWKFENHRVTDAQVSQITEALESNPSLRELEFKDSYILGCGSECIVEGMKALAKLVSKNRKFETLTLLRQMVFLQLRFTHW
jgi:hypothetical protein